MPRHLIAAGSAIAALGFLLPWASVLAGTGLGGTYWTRWGLAGPGHWLIVLALLGLVGVAVAADVAGGSPGSRSDRSRSSPRPS